MKTLILLSAIAIIGTIGLQCYENKPHSPFNAKTTNVSSKSGYNTQQSIFNPRKKKKLKTLENTEIPCKSCATAKTTQGVMQYCLIEGINEGSCAHKSVDCCDTDRCNEIKLKMIKCFHGSSKTLVNKVTIKELYKVLDIKDRPNLHVDAVECGACLTPSNTTDARAVACVPIHTVDIICKEDWANCCYEDKCNKLDENGKKNDNLKYNSGDQLKTNVGTNHTETDAMPLWAVIFSATLGIVAIGVLALTFITYRRQSWEKVDKGRLERGEESDDDGEERFESFSLPGLDEPVPSPISELNRTVVLAKILGIEYGDTAENLPFDFTDEYDFEAQDDCTETDENNQQFNQPNQQFNQPNQQFNQPNQQFNNQPNNQQFNNPPPQQFNQPPNNQQFNNQPQGYNGPSGPGYV